MKMEIQLYDIMDKCNARFAID